MLIFLESSFSTPNDLITWYIALRSYNKYRSIFGKYAGAQKDTLDEDTDKYIHLTEQFLSKFNCKMTDFQIMACKELLILYILFANLFLIFSQSKSRGRRIA